MEQRDRSVVDSKLEGSEKIYRAKRLKCKKERNR